MHELSFGRRLFRWLHIIHFHQCSFPCLTCSLVPPVSLTVTEECWKKVSNAINGQLLTWVPGSCLNERGQLIGVSIILRICHQIARILPYLCVHLTVFVHQGLNTFGLKEEDLHTSVPKLELTEIVSNMRKVKEFLECLHRFVNAKSRLF